MINVLPLLTVQVAGTPLHYLESGTGEPVLLLHGANGGAGCWAGTVRRLAPGARAVAVDLPSWGDTPPPPTFPYTMGGLTRFLLQAIDALGMPAATVIGWSFGGCAAMHLAAAAPERVKRLVLVAPAGLHNAAHWSFRALAIPILGEWLERPTPQNIWANLCFLTHDPATVPPDFFAYLQRIARHPWFRRTTLRWARRSHVLWAGARHISMARRLGEIRCPTLVIWGAEDRLIPPAQARIAAGIPDVRVVILPGAGHMPPVEQPDRFHALVQEFLGPAAPGTAAVI